MVRHTDSERIEEAGRCHVQARSSPVCASRRLAQARSAEACVAASMLGGGWPSSGILRRGGSVRTGLRAALCSPKRRQSALGAAGPARPADAGVRHRLARRLLQGAGSRGRRRDHADLDALASIIADDLALRMRDAPARSPADLLHTIVINQTLRRGQRILVADTAGRIVASSRFGRSGHHAGDAARFAAQPLTILADRAGVLRLTLPGGQDVLATVRSIGDGPNQARRDPQDGRRARPVEKPRSTRTSRLVCRRQRDCGPRCCWPIVRQAARTSRADTSCRVNCVSASTWCCRTAAAACGTGIWRAVAWNGRILCSSCSDCRRAPGRASRCCASTRLNALIHPADGGLDALARSLSSGQAGSGRPCVPHARRFGRLGVAAGQDGNGRHRHRTCAWSASPSTSPTPWSLRSVRPRRTCGCATPSRPCRKPSWCGTRKTAW